MSSGTLPINMVGVDVNLGMHASAAEGAQLAGSLLGIALLGMLVVGAVFYLVLYSAAKHCSRRPTSMVAMGLQAMRRAISSRAAAVIRKGWQPGADGDPSLIVAPMTHESRAVAGAKDGEVSHAAPLVPTTAAGLRGTCPIPKHIAVIMDGNRRYGRRQYGDATRGHWDGGRMLGTFTDWCVAAGVEALTVYAFSTENWNRDAAEIDALMLIFKSNVEEIKRKAVARGMRVNVLVSDGARIPQDLRRTFDELEALTARGTSFTLNLCVSYGARSEIARACRALARDACAGKIDVEGIDEAALGKRLLTRGMPDPELVLRTSGEVRLSNFLLYQAAYAELIFVRKCWPALTEVDFVDVVREFGRRKRRWGK